MTRTRALADPRTPVLVGAAQVTQRIDDPTAAEEALTLMMQAVEAAARDAGSASILGAVQQIAVPQGMWSYPDPGRLVAGRIGATEARTVLAEIGILQQDVLADACTQIAAGDLDVALVVGGEARYRWLRANITGVDGGGGGNAAGTAQPDGTRADRVWAAPSLGVHDIEIMRHAVDPSTAYALIEHAYAHAHDRGHDAPAIGALQARFAAIAAGNPYAWDRSSPDAAAIMDPGVPGNRMIATPYTKMCCSQCNVDQAVALLLCSAEAADRHGIPADRRVFPHSSAVSNHALPVVERAEVWRCPGAAAAGRRALDLADIRIDAVDVIDLYSCFPAAVQIYADALGLAPDDARGLTTTGGMAFFGGPLNSYALHALATMVPTLRAAPERRGLSSSVSGFLTKQGFAVWSASPPAHGFRHADVTADVTADVAARKATRPVDPDHRGPATIASWTVVHAKGAPSRAVALCDTPAGARTIATTTDSGTVKAMLHGRWIGRALDVDGAELLTLL